MTLFSLARMVNGQCEDARGVGHLFIFVAWSAHSAAAAAAAVDRTIHPLSLSLPLSLSA